MKTVPYAKTTVDTETGAFEVIYSFVSEEVNLPNGNLLVESYGVEVEKSDGEKDKVLHITPHFSQIEALLDSLCRNKVTPVALREVLEDLLV